MPTCYFRSAPVSSTISSRGTSIAGTPASAQDQTPQRSPRSSPKRSRSPCRCGRAGHLARAAEGRRVRQSWSGRRTGCTAVAPRRARRGWVPRCARSPRTPAPRRAWVRHTVIGSYRHPGPGHGPHPVRGWGRGRCSSARRGGRGSSSNSTAVDTGNWLFASSSLPST